MISRVLRYCGFSLLSICLGYHPLRFLGFYIIRYANLWHPYVDKRISLLPNVLAELEKSHGLGDVNLTDTGVLHYWTKEWFYYVPCGELSEGSLAKGYLNWERLKGGVEAGLVDYSIVKKTLNSSPVYAVERLFKFQFDASKLETVLVRLQGELVENQFSYWNFESARGELSEAIGVNRDLIDTLIITPEAGFVGVFHGDFYNENLLFNREGKLVLIDLDRLNMCGIQVFDRIHCVIVAKEKIERRHWLSFFSIEKKTWSSNVPLQLLETVSRNSLAAYFLWRQLEELQAMPVWDEAYLVRLESCFYRILEELKAPNPAIENENK